VDTYSSACERIAILNEDSDYNEYMKRVVTANGRLKMAVFWVVAPCRV
jgi:hypothetical protein